MSITHIYVHKSMDIIRHVNGNLTGNFFKQDLRFPWVLVIILVITTLTWSKRARIESSSPETGCFSQGQDKNWKPQQALKMNIMFSEVNGSFS